MTQKFKILAPNILKVRIEGKLDKAEVEQFAQELAPYLTHKSPADPMHLLIDSRLQDDRMSPEARRAFNEMGDDMRVGNIAILEPNPFMRVFVKFLSKTVQKRAMQAFDDEQEALAWLESQAAS